MQDVRRRDPERKAACVHDLQSIRVQVEENVAALGVGTMYEGVDDQLSDDRLLVCRNVGAE